MQTKKRAKPVKFGKNVPGQPAAKDEEQLKNIEETAEEIKKRVTELGDTEEELEKDVKELVEEKAEAEPTNEEEKEHRPMEAHFSSVQTYDVKEIPDEPDEEEKPEEEEAKTASSSEAAEPATVQDEEGNDHETEGLAAAGDTPEEVDTEDGSSDDNDEYFSKPPEEAERKKGGFSYFFKVVIITFLIGIAFIGGIYYAFTNKRAKNILPFKKTEVTSTPVTDTPTQAPVDLTKYEIKVLNGSGTPGLAAKLKTQLEADGFKVGSVGNAEKSDYQQTEIAAGKEVDKEYIGKLKDELSKTYQVAESPRSASGAADVIVTIGSLTAK